MIEAVIAIVIFLAYNMALIWLVNKITLKSGKHIRYINYEMGTRPRPIIPDQKLAHKLWQKQKKTEKSEPPPVVVKSGSGDQPPEVVVEPEPGSKRYST